MTRNKRIFTRKIIFYLVLIILGIGFFLNFDKIAQGAVNITGDVYSGGSLGNNITVGNNSVVSANGTVDVKGTNYKIGNYNRTKVLTRVNDIIPKLKTLSSKKLDSELFSPPEFKLNPNNFPEGTVWYRNGNLTVKGGTYSGKGTIIVENGNLKIDGDIKYSNPKTDSIGFIVSGVEKNGTGNITISNSVTELHGAYFATGAIIIEGNK